MIKGFKDFITRGNVIDLAVAVVIGAAFGAVVTAIVTRVFNPLIGLLFQADSLDSSLVLTIGDAKLQFGAVIGAIISFLLIALVVYLVFIYPMNKIMMLRKKTVADAELNEVELLTQIRELVRQPNPPHAVIVGGGEPVTTAGCRERSRPLTHRWQDVSLRAAPARGGARSGVFVRGRVPARGTGKRRDHPSTRVNPQRRLHTTDRANRTQAVTL